MPHQGFVVPPRSRGSIRSDAQRIRAIFDRVIQRRDKVSIDRIYELLPDMLEGFTLEVLEDHELGKDHGRTFPARRLVQLRSSVYDGMCRGVGRDRFTGAHELGHLFLHADVAFARTLRIGERVEAYRDSEWQANTFASALLIDEALMRPGMSVEDVAETFGVSTAAASVRLKK